MGSDPFPDAGNGERDGNERAFGAVSSEKGQALTETVLLGLLLLVPLIWVLGVLADVHRSALAATAAARDGGTSAARSADPASAALALDVAIARALQDHGLPAADAVSSWAAAPRFERGARVEVRVRYPVPVMQAPLLGRVAGPAIWIEASHVARIHPFISRP